MATQEESAPAAETTQPESNEAAPPPTADDTTAADSPAATADAAPSSEAAAAEAAAAVIPRVVIVTGASSGLGLEVSRVLCEAGHDVIMACRSEEKANRAIDKLTSVSLSDKRDKLKKQNLKGTLTYLHVCTPFVPFNNNNKLR